MPMEMGPSRLKSFLWYRYFPYQNWLYNSELRTTFNFHWNSTSVATMILLVVIRDRNHIPAASFLLSVGGKFTKTSFQVIARWAEKPALLHALFQEVTVSSTSFVGGGSEKCDYLLAMKEKILISYCEVSKKGRSTENWQISQPVWLPTRVDNENVFILMLRLLTALRI